MKMRIFFYNFQCEIGLSIRVKRNVSITPKHYNDLIDSLIRLIAYLGQGCRIESISTLDLQNYRWKLQSAYGSVDRPNLRIRFMKAMLHWAKK